ncbi:hypothetical protein RJZ90_007473 [Blastomyces dermatitidis]
MSTLSRRLVYSPPFTIHHSPATHSANLLFLAWDSTVKEIDLLKAPATSEGLYDYDGGEGSPVATGKRKMDGQPEYGALISGQVITLTTDDVAKRPLPSWPLLELQWHLQRVAGMSGAAEARDEVGRNDDGDDGELVVLDRDAAANRVTSISQWLQQLTDNGRWHPSRACQSLFSDQCPAKMAEETSVKTTAAF